MATFRPHTPQPVWQTALLPSSLDSKSLTQSLSHSYNPNALSHVFYPPNTLLHTPHYTPFAFIKYHPSLSDLNKVDTLLSFCQDEAGNLYDLPSTHPRLLASIIATPQLFMPAQNPIIQPFSYSTLNPYHNPPDKPDQYRSNILSASSRCHNNNPMDGLSLDEVNVLRSAILSASQALADLYPLPRQVISYVNSLLHTLLQKYPIYALGPLNMVPVVLIFCACRLLELQPKYTDLFNKYNHILNSTYSITTSSKFPPPNPNPTNTRQSLLKPLTPQVKRSSLVQQYRSPIPWFQEYLPPYLCGWNSTTESIEFDSHDNPAPECYLDHAMILRYQFEICHCMHQTRTAVGANQFSTQLPFDQFEPQNSAGRTFSHLIPPTILTQVTAVNQDLEAKKSMEEKRHRSQLEPLNNTINSGLHGTSFNETWLEYLSLIDHHCINSFSTTSPISSQQFHRTQSRQMIVSKPCTPTSPNDVVCTPSVHPIPLQHALSLDQGSYLFQFLLLSLLSLIPIAVNTEKKQSSLHDPQHIITITASSTPHPSVAPPNFTFLDAMIFDSSNFKGSHMMVNPLPDLVLALLSRLELTIPTGHNFPTTLIDSSIYHDDTIHLYSSLINLSHYQDNNLPNQFFNQSLDLSNSNSLTHIASFIANVASYADQLPLQLLYPPQVIAISILDLVISLLQLPPPTLLPTPTHSSCHYKQLPYEPLQTNQNGPGSLSDPSSSSPQATLHNFSLDHFTRVGSVANSKANLLSINQNHIALDAMLQSWSQTSGSPFLIQNGCVKRNFHLTTPPSFPDSSSVQIKRSQPASYWYHSIIPGLDPAIVVSIALAIVLGTKLGYSITTDTPNTTLTLRVLALQRYPWCNLHHGAGQLPPQLETVSAFYHSSLDPSQNDSHQGKTSPNCSHFTLNPQAFISFHSNQRQNQLRFNFRAQMTDIEMNKSDLTPIVQPITSSYSRASIDNCQHDYTPPSRLVRRNQLTSGCVGYSSLVSQMQSQIPLSPPPLSLPVVPTPTLTKSLPQENQQNQHSQTNHVNSTHADFLDGLFD